jgi:hypothetical protein
VLDCRATTHTRSMISMLTRGDVLSSRSGLETSFPLFIERWLNIFFWLFPIVVWILIDDLRDPRGRLRRPCAVDHFGTQDRACMCSFPPGKRMFPKHFSLLRRMSDEQPWCLVVQANMIPISWDRVLLYHLEETSVGVWQPVLSTS